MRHPKNSWAEAWCQVCHANLLQLGSNGHCLLKRVCPQHLQANMVYLPEHSGKPHRFCHQCGRFEPLSCFVGNKRSCHRGLQQHHCSYHAIRANDEATVRAHSCGVAHRAAAAGVSALQSHGASSAGVGVHAAASAAPPTAGVSKGVEQRPQQRLADCAAAAGACACEIDYDVGEAVFAHVMGAMLHHELQQQQQLTLSTSQTASAPRSAEAASLPDAQDCPMATTSMQQRASATLAASCGGMAFDSHSRRMAASTPAPAPAPTAGHPAAASAVVRAAPHERHAPAIVATPAQQPQDEVAQQAPGLQARLAVLRQRLAAAAAALQELRQVANMDHVAEVGADSSNSGYTHA